MTHAVVLQWLVASCTGQPMHCYCHRRLSSQDLHLTFNTPFSPSPSRTSHPFFCLVFLRASYGLYQPVSSPAPLFTTFCFCCQSTGPPPRSRSSSLAGRHQTPQHDRPERPQPCANLFAAWPSFICLESTTLCAFYRPLDSLCDRARAH